MAAVAGVRGTGDWGTDERPKNFREGIMFLNPNGSSPLFALTAKMGKDETDDPEFSWWDEPNNITRLQLSKAVSKPSDTSTAVDVTVDSGDPTATNLTANRGNAQNLVPGDLLMVEQAGTAGSDVAYAAQIIQVTSITSATVFKAIFGQANTTNAALKDNAWLTKIGNVFAEGTRSPTSASRNPVKFNNYTQIFKTTYEVTGTAGKTKARTGDLLKNEKRRKMFDHSTAIEFAMMFGQAHEGTGSNGKPQRYMGGVREYVTNHTMKSSWKYNDLIDQLSRVFDWESPAGDERMAFIGNGALNAINKRLLGTEANSIVSMNFEGTSSMYGVRFKRVVVPQGTLYLKTHPLMSRHPVFTNSMFIADGSCLKWTPLRGRDTKFKDNIQHNDEDTIKGQWMTEGGIKVLKGGVTQLWVDGFNN